MDRTQTPPKLITLILLTGIATLSLNMFVPSLAHMADALASDYALISLSIGGYLAVTAVLQLVIGPLSDRFGRRPIILIAMGIFTLASIGCFLAQDVWSFLTFRILQGAVIAGAALSPAIVRDTHSPEQTVSKLGYISMAMAVAPMLGPMLGGMLDQMFGWRASFVFFICVGFGLFWLSWADLGETNRAPSQTFSRQFLAYPKVLSNPRFWAFALCKAFSTGAFYAFLAGVPIIAVTAFGVSTGALGFYVGSITGGFFLGSWVAGFLGKRWSLTATMLLGRIVSSVGLCIGLVIAVSGDIAALLFFTSTLCVGFGNGVTMPASSSGAMSVDPDLAGSASGLAGALTVGTGAVVTTITGIILSANPQPAGLLLIMLGITSLSLIAAVWALWDDARSTTPKFGN
jgi:Bcr/CflA subfamily drug resistance transporter